MAQRQLRDAIEHSKHQAVQRVVDLDGETDAANIWAQVGPLVITRYRRKQTLFAWVADGDTRNYLDAQVLADDLDTANRRGCQMGRNRSAWAPNLTTVFSQTH